MKPIIIYYSRSGNTEKIALQAKNDLNCEAIKIVPEEAYGHGQIIGQLSAVIRFAGRLPFSLVMARHGLIRQQF